MDSTSMKPQLQSIQFYGTTATQYYWSYLNLASLVMHTQSFALLYRAGLLHHRQWQNTQHMQQWVQAIPNATGCG
jgi:hypothetical protein